jgi:hypothetical protein
MGGVAQQPAAIAQEASMQAMTVVAAEIDALEVHGAVH